MTAADIPEMDFVVVGGFPLDRGTNHRSVQTVRSLLEIGRVLYIYDDPQGSALRTMISRRPSAWPESRRNQLVKVGQRMKAEQRGSHLWLAPVRGLAKLLPLSYPEFVRSRFSKNLGRFIQREVAGIGMVEPTIWFYWWFFPELVDAIDGSSVYDNIDDHGDYLHNEKWGRVRSSGMALEQRLLDRVDLAYAQSGALAEKMRATQPNTIEKPPGLDIGVVEAALDGKQSAGDISAIPTPRIVYAGNTGNRMDWTLVRDLAIARPEWSFVFLGGKEPELAKDVENLYFLASRPYDQMLRGVRECQIGIVPWRDSPATRGAYAYKALDYLAAGRQVVTTDMPFASDLASRFPEVVNVANSREEWLAVLDNCLVEAEAPLVIAECRRAARSRSSTIRTREIVADIIQLSTDGGTRDGRA